MKTYKTALMLLGCLSLPVLSPPVVAQIHNNNPPDCTEANYDRTRDIFTVFNAMPGENYQQCLLTVLPGTVSLYLAARPLRSAPQFTEGTYAITIAGDGGGSRLTHEGREGGGASAVAPLVSNQYLAAGTYRLTIAGSSAGSGNDVTRGSNASSSHGFISIRRL